MSGPALVLWQAASIAAFALWALGWGVLAVSFEKLVRGIRAELAGRPSRPPGTTAFETVLLGVALVQIGGNAGIILMTMEGA